MKTKRAILVEPRRFEIQEFDISPKVDEVLVKVASCGLCSWELNHWTGALGPYPQTMGHEWAGTVVDMGKEAQGFKEGDTITMFPPPDPISIVLKEGFAEYATISTQCCVKIAKDLDPKYAFAEPLKCIVTVLRACEPNVGDNGVIIGCGPMGLWCIQGLAGNSLNTLIAVDIDDKKLELAKKYGATHTINSKDEDAYEKIKDITGGHLADFVIEGTGIPAMMNIGLTYVRGTGRGKLIMMSSHKDVTKEFSFKMAMEKSAEIRVAHPLYSLNQYDDLRRAVLLINKGVFNIKDLVTHEFVLDNINEAFMTLENKPAVFLKGLVTP